MGCCCSVDSLTLMFYGLCNSGKSTIIGQIEYHTFRVTNPTIGHEISNAIFHDKQVELWDVSGRETDHWMIYRKQADGIVFVLDGRNKKDIQIFAGLANQVLDAEEANKKPILIYINWASADSAIKQSELMTILKVETRENSDIYLQECNAKTGEGIIEGYNWIMSRIETALSV